MKRLSFLLLFFIVYSSLSAQPVLHQSNTFIFNNSNTVPTGNHIFEAAKYNEFQTGSEYNPAPGVSLEARINPYLIFPPEGGETGGPNPGDNGVVGTLPGSIAVSPSGAAIYSVPIEIPAGVNGLQPSLAIVYNSHGGNGYLGMGCSISGLSSITRSNSNIYYDGFVKDPNFEEDDQFSLDGTRLLVINGKQAGTEGAEYHTVVESFSKVISHCIEGKNGPQSFEVYTKEGNKVEFGFTENSRVLAPGRNDGTVLYWLVNRISDKIGNFISFEYMNDNNLAGAPWKISYTGNSKTQPNIEPFYTVEFLYENRPDTVTAYLSGSQINFSARLNKINITYNPLTTVEKSYFLEYTNTCTSVACDINKYYSHLSRITLSDGFGNHLNPTTLIWGDELPLNQHITTSTTTALPQGELYTCDFNGDGKTDYIRVLKNLTIPYKWELWLASQDGTDFNKCSSTECPINEGNLDINCIGFLSGDFNGDGLNDFLISKTDIESSAHFIVYFGKSDNSGYKGFQAPRDISFMIGFQNILFELYAADFNGDGQQDIIARRGHRSENPAPSHLEDNWACDIYLATRINGIFYFTEHPSGEYPPTIPGINRFIIGHFISSQKMDIMVLQNTISKIYYYDSKLQAISSLPNSGYPTKFHRIFSGDFNGDGVTDVLTCTNETFEWGVTLFTGKEWTWPEYKVDFLAHHDPQTEQYKVFIQDYNGDGKSDLLLANGLVSPTKLEVYFSRGQKLAFITPPETSITTSIDMVFENKFRFNDFNGDGKADFLYTDYTNSPLMIVNIHSCEQTEFVKKVINGFGKTDEILFSPLTNSEVYSRIYSQLINCNLVVDWMDYQGPLYVVRKVSIDNGSGFYETTYKYDGAKIHSFGKGFLGYTLITKNDNLGCSTTDHYTFYQNLGYPEYPNLFWYTYVEKSQSFFTDANNNSHKTNDIDYYYDFIRIKDNLNHLTKIIWPQLFQSESSSWEINGTDLMNHCFIQYDYDSYANIKELRKTDDLGGSSYYYENKTYTYFYDTDDWILSRMKSLDIEKGKTGSGNQVSSQLFEYYQKGDFRYPLLKQTIIAPEDPLSTITELDYLSNGNILTQKISAPNGNGIQERLTQYYYDLTTGNRFPISEVNPMGFISTSVFDPITGDILSTTDVNGLVTTFQRTGLGTFSKVILPDEKISIEVLRWANGNADAPTGAVYYSWIQTSGSSSKLIFFDRNGKELRIVNYGFINQTIYVDKQYDQFGRPTKTSIPYFPGETILYTESKYNTSLPRVDYKIFPDQTHLWYTYNGPVTITTNQAGQTTSQKTNALGLLEESKDANLKTVRFEYSYDGNNFITTSKIQGYDNTLTTIQVDRFGRRTKISDLSSGTLEETYNAFGELVSSKNQKQTDLNKTLFSNDKLGRILTRTEDGQLTTWTYDSKPFGIGKPDKVANNDQTIEYFYDGLGRTRQTNETINGEKNEAGEKTIFSFTYTYDEFSRLKEETYPSTITIRNYYNNNGYLYKITDPHMGNKTLWKTTTHNSKEQLTQALIGDKFTSDYNYDPATGNLSSIHSFTQDTELQDEEYQWYPIGNLYGRKKWINRTTSLFLEEQFTYDNLNRLKTVSLNNQANNTFAYDDLGNITNKPPLTDMVYGDNNSPPYAIQSANFSGNVIPDIAQDITYTIFDKIHTISEDVSNLEMTYGIDHERIRQIITIDGVESCRKLYLGGGCERITDGTGTRYINYINGPQGIFAIIEKDTDGHENLHFVLKDHLGSFNYITDKSGKLQEELSFDPWGRRRNSTDWTYVGVPSTHIYDRGFTGHEHLDDFGLINMNGRAYDPIVGRFLSADAFVQGPSTQNFNRYSYCLNNPLKYSDPSGQLFLVDDFIIAAGIGMLVNTAVQLVTNRVQSVGDFFLSAGIGAASGVAASFGGVMFDIGIGGFAGGAMSGMGVGMAGGFVGGAGNAWASGANFGEGLSFGLKSGLIGGLIGGTVGGISGGIQAISQKGDLYRKVGDGLELTGPELTEKQVETSFIDEMGFGEGQEGIGDISTKPGKGSFMNESHLFQREPNAVYSKPFQYYAVTEQPSFWDGSQNIRISPYATRNEIFLRGVIHHEYQHVVQTKTGLERAWSNSRTLLEKNARLHELNYYRSLPQTLQEQPLIQIMMRKCIMQ